MAAVSGIDDDVPATIRVLAAVIRRRERFLLCLRPHEKRHGGMWEFPGGKLEPDESLHDAARRELMEELGVLVTHVDDPAFTCRDHGSPFVIEFTPIEISGEPRALEHEDVRWVTLSEAVRLSLAPADHAFVMHLLHQNG